MTETFFCPPHKESIKPHQYKTRCVVTDEQRRVASSIIKSLRERFTRESCAAQLGICESYVSMISYMSKNHYEKYMAPGEAVMKVIGWGAVQ